LSAVITSFIDQGGTQATGAVMFQDFAVLQIADAESSELRTTPVSLSCCEGENDSSLTFRLRCFLDRKDEARP
jgi:hypothetical protein